MKQKYLPILLLRNGYRTKCFALGKKTLAFILVLYLQNRTILWKFHMNAQWNENNCYYKDWLTVDVKQHPSVLLCQMKYCAM